MERNQTKQNNKIIATKANNNKLRNKFADTNLLEKYYLFLSYKNWLNEMINSNVPIIYVWASIINLKNHKKNSKISQLVNIY